MRLSKRAKKLLPRFLRRVILQSRRSQNGHHLIGRQLETVAEKKWQYDEMMDRWIRSRDPHAKDSALKLLDEMRSVVAKMAKNQLWKEFEPSIRRMRIPGWRQAASKTRSR